ncbi:putative PEP-CTERM system TPR-repeat lipoprotein [Aspergillus parasiticus SU-1]|uniref:ER membrane protein complex subunit 2 n=2 Tax=Aspergillus parasiticus TaxID=5067 RepID=A0A5N6DAN3_ASPPA|nr:hypothetical protein BDV34DRAFT_228474 [Aspergillus parasiticus]KJK60134.1 putative PEP-CTERM system TPR-repeat lipoprotein [Aspergillus parasiticus SU-1]
MAHATPDFHATHSSSPITTLRFSQQAPVILERQLHSGKNLISALIAKQEEPEKYGIIEQLFFSCLQTGDDRSALLCLEQLTRRFGSSNEKVMGLRGLYEEAICENQSDLEDSLRKYDSYLLENPLNLPILKRRIALLRSLARPADAITGLVELLKAVPTDAEAWCELADLYQSQGLSSQAIFSLEEALLIAPNAWNIHARLGEVLYICARAAETEVTSRYLRRSIQYFCRSVELCDDYLRGFYGLILATSLQLGREYTMDFSQASSSASSEDFLPKEKVVKLNLLARRKLEDIVKQRSMNRQLWEHAQGELIAAKELLDRESY